MTHFDKVLESINNEDASRCVDIFQRSDGTFGYEEYRRDVEDSRGWFPVGFYGDQVYETAEQALVGAEKTVNWLAKS